MVYSGTPELRSTSGPIKMPVIVLISTIMKSNGTLKSSRNIGVTVKLGSTLVI